MCAGSRRTLQGSPANLHRGLLDELDVLGWGERWPTVVMARSAGPTATPPHRDLTLDDEATPEWLAVWGECETRDEAEVAAHARTVFALLRGRAAFAHLGNDAAAIAVPGEDLLGLFCIAVAPERRRAGLGTAITTALLARLRHRTAYLQVEERNTGAIALYERLGFRAVYRYHHRTR